MDVFWFFGMVLCRWVFDERFVVDFKFFLMKYNGGEYIANFKGGGYTQINAWMIGYRYQGCYGHTNL